MNVSPLLPLGGGGGNLHMASFISPANSQHLTSHLLPPAGLVALPSSTSFSHTRRDGWLRLEVCREYQRKKCSRSAEECKYAHPPSHVDQEDGFVVCCYDSLKNNCKRAQPPCKFLHPPEHLKTQLLERGKQNLQARSGTRPMNVLQPISMFSPHHSSHLLPLQILPYLATTNPNAAALYSGFMYPYLMNQSSDAHHAATASVNNLALLSQHPHFNQSSQNNVLSAKLLTSMVHQMTNGLSHSAPFIDERNLATSNLINPPDSNSPDESFPNSTTSMGQSNSMSGKPAPSSGKRECGSARSVRSPSSLPNHNHGYNTVLNDNKATSRSTPCSSPNRYNNISVAATLAAAQHHQQQLAHQIAAAHQNSLFMMTNHQGQSQHPHSQHMASCSLTGLLPAAAAAMVAQPNSAVSYTSQHSSNAFNPYTILAAHGQPQMPY